MTREYKKVKHLLPEILRLKQEGKTHREIAAIYGLTKEQVKKLVGRYYLKQRKANEGVPPKNRRGRPRKTPPADKEVLERENQRLRMENDLLRSFLQAAGRGRDPK